MDANCNLQQLKNAVNTFVQERDWQQFHSGKNLAIAISCEAAELLEYFQWIDVNKSDEVIEENKEAILQELADIIIATLCFANRYNIDVSEIVLNKIKVISERYPIEKAKGNFTKYTKL